jgi:hypothetical protein
MGGGAHSGSGLEESAESVRRTCVVCGSVRQCRSCSNSVPRRNEGDSVGLPLCESSPTAEDVRTERERRSHGIGVSS